MNTNPAFAKFTFADLNALMTSLTKVYDDASLSDPASEYLFGVTKDLERELVARPSETPTEALTKLLWFGGSNVESEIDIGPEVVADAARFTHPVAAINDSPAQEAIQ